MIDRRYYVEGSLLDHLSATCPVLSARAKERGHLRIDPVTEKIVPRVRSHSGTNNGPVAPLCGHCVAFRSVG